MRTFNTGPAGMIVMAVGGLLAVSSAWTALSRSAWAHALPSILIGLSLLAAGYTLVAVARQRRSRSGSDGPEGDEL